MWYFQEISFLFSQNIPLKVITMFMDSAVILYSFAQSFPIFLTFVEFLREFLSTQNWGTLLTRQKLRYFSGIEYKGWGGHLLAGAGGAQ